MGQPVGRAVAQHPCFWRIRLLQCWSSGQLLMPSCKCRHACLAVIASVQPCLKSHSPRSTQHAQTFLLACFVS